MTSGRHDVSPMEADFLPDVGLKYGVAEEGAGD
jgi:hypothetical protein